MAPTFSKLGIYVKETADLDTVFFYSLPTRADAFIAVPIAGVFKARVLIIPEQDRTDWIAVGSYNDTDYGYAITTETLAKHTQRIAESLLDEVEVQKRQKQAYMGALDARGS